MQGMVILWAMSVLTARSCRMGEPLLITLLGNEADENAEPEECLADIWLTRST